MNKNNTNFILIISTLLLIVLTGSFLYFFSVIKNKNKHISAVVISLNKKMSEKNNINSLEKKMVELVDTQNKISSYIVNPARVDIFVEYLEKIGDESGTTFLVKSVNVPKKEKNKIQVVVAIEGSFADVAKAVALLENSPYVISINSSFINKQIVSGGEVSTTENKKDEVVVSKKPTWQANINFNVLSL